ncbi:MmgE/PrpD family protein [Oceanobacillus halophilus]|uniref:MmgE/PrpD family protein n=1 Tax=Oceanobacillus halophilus TaxID=930130 RepID=A0A495A7R7_9BACI|nr:MmgE/PrpD family protein [Oceanobacillus halophilus]RKQ35788.1 MmgE/PrpD family protein [Oceanobacillus halophilus]
MGLSKKLASYIIDTNYDNIPEEVVEFTKLCILDYFGSAIAGSTKAPVKMVHDFAVEMGGEPQATLVTGGKTSVAQAALVNGAASHIVELDDIHKASIIHAATVVVPAALAVAEWKKLSGKDLITAVVIGYEVCYRIGEAVTPSHYYYWHNTATCGTFGAAAAVSKLLELHEEQIVHALGSAGTQAAGLWEFIEDGAMSKQLHPGKAAMNGVISGLLAQKGFTGASEILEGDRGFFRAMSESFDESKVTNNLGKEFKIMENGFKIHASCRHTHHAMDLMIDLRNESDLSLDLVESIKVKTYQVALNITDNDSPETEYASKFSLQYCTALALVKGEGGLDVFNQENLWNEDVRNMMGKVEVEVDPDIDDNYPEKWGVKVEVSLSNGEKITKQTDYPKGDTENPVTEIELQNKFLKLAKKLSINERERLSAYVLRLGDIEKIEKIMSVFIKVR